MSVIDDIVDFYKEVPVIDKAAQEVIESALHIRQHAKGQN